MRPDPAPPINFPDDPISLAELVAIAVAASEAAQVDVDTHEARVDNPHVVTAAQTGAATTGALATETTNRTNADTALSGLIGTEATDRGNADTALQLDIDTHEARVDNPHAVNKTQVGLGNVDNTSDVNKPVSTAQAAADALALHLAGTETATGVKTFSAGLDVYGRDGALQILLANAANRGAIITGAASQSANLFELRNSANTLLTSFSAAGVASLAGQTDVGDGTGRGVLFGTDALLISNGASSLTLRNAADSAYSTLTMSQMRAASQVTGGATGTISNVYHYLNNNTAASVALVVRGAASQTANLQEWQNSAGTLLSYFDSAGELFLRTGKKLRFWDPSNVGNIGIYNDGNGALRVIGHFGVESKMWLGVGTAYDTSWERAGAAIMKTAGSLVATAQITGGSAASVAGIYHYLLNNTAASVGLVVRGAASQSANIQEWQTSSAAVLAAIDIAGGFTAQGGGSAHRLRIVTDATRGYIQYDDDIRFTPVSSTTERMTFSTTGDIRVSGQVGSITASKAYMQPNFDTNGVGFFANGAANKVVVVRGSASQTANLQEWQDSAGSNWSAITSSGRLLIRTSSTTAQVNVATSGTTTIGAIIQGAASQTADLQQWRNSTPQPMTAIGPDGKILFYDGAGSATDTNLYRSAADTLKTDDNLHIVGLLKWVTAGNEQTTVGAAGAATALPVLPTKYLKVVDSAGTTLVIPAYAAT